MRQVVLDTETTGLEVSQGHRIIEIGCVELLHRRTTDQQFHQFLNPEREIDAGAQEVHGISAEFLADKPKFVSIADDFIEFIKDAELIIHNASFDVGFLNALDALCRRYEIDNSHRELHGALLDAQILADVYLALTGGQASLSLSADSGAGSKMDKARLDADMDREALNVILANEAEVQAHDAFLSKIQQESDAGCVWLKDKSD